MTRKRSLAVLFDLWVVISLIGCNLLSQLPGTPRAPGAPATPTTFVPPDLPAPAAKNSAQALENVARLIYDTLADGHSLNPYISGVMSAFGVPPLGEADVDLLEQRYKQGLPLLLAPQVSEMADAYQDASYVSLDSFITAANNRGAKQEGSSEPLTREYLTGKFANYTGKTQYAHGQVLPAFVLALGQERAKRFPPENADPLWGDGLLDPLQLTLLLYSVSYSGAGPLSAQAPAAREVKVSFNTHSIQGSLSASVPASDPIEDWIKEQIEDQITGEVQDAIELPLDKKEAAQVSVCASLLLYGHKLKVTNTPKLIYHKDGEKPSTTRVDVTLTFEDDYWGNYLQIDRWVLENLANCTLPHRGPVEGKPLEWSISSGLRGHGDFDVVDPQTDGLGEASSSWKTVPETTPKSQRTFHNQRDAVGAIIVRAGSLVPGWSTLERIVGLLKDTGNTGDAPLTVIYYIPRSYKAVGQQGVSSYKGLICDLEKPFTLEADISAYDITVNFTPSTAEAGSFTLTGKINLSNSTTFLTGDGHYTVKNVDGNASQLVLDVENATGTNTLAGGGSDAGFQLVIDLVPLDTRECD